MNTFEGWYCAHCQRGVDASEVTFHEQHTVCGRTITDDVPPKASIKEPVTTEQPKDGPAGWRPMTAHRPRYGQRVFLRRSGVVQIAAPTFDGGGGDDGDFWDFDTFGIDSTEVDWESDEWMPIDDLGNCLDAVKAERDALRAENDKLRERVKELESAARAARDALAVAIKSAWEGTTDEEVAEHVVIKKLDAAMQEGKSRATTFRTRATCAGRGKHEPA